MKMFSIGSINVAYGKPTRQYPWTYCEPRPSTGTVAGGHYCHNSSFAVDGNMDTCSRTIGNESDTYGLWLVYLEQPYVLHSLKIYRNLSDGKYNFPLNVSTASKGSFVYILFVMTAAGVVPCGDHKTSPRTSSIVQIILNLSVL